MNIKKLNTLLDENKGGIKSAILSRANDFVDQYTKNNTYYIWEEMSQSLYLRCSGIEIA